MKKAKHKAKGKRQTYRKQLRATCFLLVGMIFALAGIVVAQNSGPARDAWQRPEDVMDALNVRLGSTVADVGCGAGYFVFHLADRVGPRGRVYGEDILKFRLDQVQHEAEREGLSQIETIHGTPDNPRLPSSSLDAVLAVNTYHEWHSYPAMLQHVYASLKPGGLFGLIDASAQMGHPRSYYYEHHRMPEQMERAEVTRAGFRLLRQEQGFTRTSDGRKFYFLVFQKPQ
ncbi:MAG: class I SAM-dependent methyltransferase [Terriglobia bacterium]